MWSLYLGYCEAGFRTGYLDVAAVDADQTHLSRALGETLAPGVRSGSVPW